MIVHHDVTRRLDAVVEEEPMHVGGNNMTVVVVDDDMHHRGATDGNAHEEGVEVIEDCAHSLGTRWGRDCT